MSLGTTGSVSKERERYAQLLRKQKKTEYLQRRRTKPDDLEASPSAAEDYLAKFDPVFASRDSSVV